MIVVLPVRDRELISSVAPSPGAE